MQHLERTALLAAETERHLSQQRMSSLGKRAMKAMSSGSVDLSLWQRRNVRILKWQKSRPASEAVAIRNFSGSNRNANLSTLLPVQGDYFIKCVNINWVRSQALCHSWTYANLPGSSYCGTFSPERDSRGSNSRTGKIAACLTQTLTLMSPAAEWYQVPQVQEHGSWWYHLHICPLEWWQWGQNQYAGALYIHIKRKLKGSIWMYRFSKMLWCICWKIIREAKQIIYIIDPPWLKSSHQRSRLLLQKSFCRSVKFTIDVSWCPSKYSQPLLLHLFLTLFTPTFLAHSHHITGSSKRTPKYMPSSQAASSSFHLAFKWCSHPSASFRTKSSSVPTKHWSAWLGMCSGAIWISIFSSIRSVYKSMSRPGSSASHLVAQLFATLYRNSMFTGRIPRTVITKAGGGFQDRPHRPWQIKIDPGQ